MSPATAAVSVLRNEWVVPSGGAEVGYSWLDGYSIALRAGRDVARCAARRRFTAGAGFNMDRLSIDYALETLSRLAHRPPHRPADSLDAYIAPRLRFPLTAMRRALILGTIVVAALHAGAQADQGRLADGPLAPNSSRAPNPGERGSFAVKTMYYGSGTDKRRAEFRDSVTIKTKTVDASPFVSMEPPVAKSREKDWGFRREQVPGQRPRVVSGGRRPLPARADRARQSRPARLLGPWLRLPRRAAGVARIHSRVGR